MCFEPLSEHTRLLFAVPVKIRAPLSSSAVWTVGYRALEFPVLYYFSYEMNSEEMNISIFNANFKISVNYFIL